MTSVGLPPGGGLAGGLAGGLEGPLPPPQAASNIPNRESNAQVRFIGTAPY